jgi:hypothetical protein
MRDVVLKIKVPVWSVTQLQLERMCVSQFPLLLHDSFPRAVLNGMQLTNKKTNDINKAVLILEKQLHNQTFILHSISKFLEGPTLYLPFYLQEACNPFTLRPLAPPAQLQP